MSNKRFQNNNDPSDVVTIIGDNGVFYNLSNGANIKKDIFFQRYSEMLDVSSFFQQAPQITNVEKITEQIRNLDTSKIPGGDIPPTVRHVEKSVSEQIQAPPEYREMILKKYEAEQAHREELSQYKVFEDDDEAAADFERKLKQQQAPQQPRPRRRPEEEQWMGVNSTFQTPQEPIMESSYQNTTSPYISAEEEAFKFFRSFKKVYPIKLAVEFDEKIAEPAFIKLMAVNYEGDIIKFYTKEIMNRIYNDPGFLENKVYEKLRNLIFEEEEKPKKQRKPKSLTEGKEKEM